MNVRRQALEQALAEANPGPRRWPTSTVPDILRVLWNAYDRLLKKLLTIDLSIADLQLERSIAALLSDEVNEILHETGGYCSYLVSHERWECETIAVGSNRPPQYDLAFIWKGHSYLKWPCEVKVLKNETDIGDYLRDVQEAFLPCIYAPFSNSGAMVGLLRQGNPSETLRLIGVRLGVPIEQHAFFSSRPHATTAHTRIVPEGKTYASKFTMHHMIFALFSGN